ncbi:leucine-rich repeat domain-containing protein [Flavobacterium polysaccharolyticum]|uniref:Leucine-rich repeat domain-containing protein n=1 Tax=Flavobacterium polysaccharolyticum TaxID=3133148 RepID=A0ABU9NHT6_9FLAO
MKPVTILNLEKTLGFGLNLSTIDDFFDFKNRNTFKINDDGEVISLNLFGNKITNISFIKEFQNLKELDLRNNPIRDFTPLENFKQLILFGYGIHKINSQSYINDFLKKDI